MLPGSRLPTQNVSGAISTGTRRRSELWLGLGTGATVLLMGAAFLPFRVYAPPHSKRCAAASSPLGHLSAGGDGAQFLRAGGVGRRPCVLGV
ncbi:hypothetical protein MVI01_12760 [Myxococcus virescens]|uniref:Uncharacterized protein n=1 Tax=Myxococcus virescens TaxID=83456 RepID=A0A511H7H2_9BACT|nr:hypothetical protein MVI01_12760 [Myxococcus virescens]